MSDKWIVVGGGDKGGIVVRGEKATSSPQADSRLSTGALVKRLKLEGERLQYERILGTGPSTGWVSTKLKDKALLVPAGHPVKFEVVIKPSMFLRKDASATAEATGSLNAGEKVDALEWSFDEKWIRVDKDKWAMITHPQKGQLLSLVMPDVEKVEEPQSLKKSWEVEFKFKGCGANVTGLAGGTGGASRDQLFEFLSLQHLQVQLRQEFRENIAEHMYDTGAAEEADCVAFFQTAGHLMIDPPEPGRKPKPSPGGVRQYVKTLGDLRCIVVQKEGGGKPSTVVVLAHGIQVLGDDLYGLADYLAKPGILLVLPQAPHECEVERPEDEEWRRLPLQWWLPKKNADVMKDVLKAGTQLAECVKEALGLAAPDAKLVLGGFSQGAGVALTAALSPDSIGTTPAGLILLSSGPPPDPLPADSLNGAVVLVSAGEADPIAPASGCEKLHEACAAAGASVEPLVRYFGGHEVTVDVAKAVNGFLTKIAKS